MVKRPGGTHYEEITWDEAFQLMADELHALPSPDAAAFYTSGRTSNEAAFLYQLFVRQFGTNNLPDCSNMCHEASGAALNETIGIGKGCVTLDDFTKTDCVFIVGQNPGTNHPRMMTSLEHAKKNGATIISANPLPETGLMRVVNPNPQEYRNPLKFPVKMLLNKGTPLTDIWLPVRINGDMAMFKGIMKEMLAEEDKQPGSVFDLDFIRDYTVDAEAMIADLRAADWDEITKQSGLSRAQIRADRRGDHARQEHDHLLGDGPDPASQRRRDDPVRDEPAAPARGHRQTRRGAMPGARPFQRAGRPHDGHLGAHERHVHGQAGQGIFVRSAQAARRRCRGVRQGDAPGRHPVFPRAWAAISCPPCRTRTTPPPRCRSAG